MAKNISLFPTLTRLRSKDIFTIPVPELKYTRGGKKWPLTLNEPDSPISSISDDNGFWNADEHDAKIGVALSWFSSDSRRRSTIPLATLDNDSDVLHAVKCQKHFSVAELRGEVGFALVLYLQEAGVPEDDEIHFANVPGTILGEIKAITLCLDGHGSFFTIYEVNKPGQPLWDVEYSIDDPSTDQFADCVAVCLNRAHKKYPLVKRGSDSFCQQLLIEIMGNSIATIIEMVGAYERDDNFDCLEEIEEGSVAQALAYFKDKLLWDFSTPITVSHSARLFIDRNIKDYENNRIQ